MTRKELPTNGEPPAGQAVRAQHSGQPVFGSDVLERPALSPNVQLIGEMRQTGYEDRQWLVRRDARFIQLTELLYRVAEQANGERTLEDIAAGVTESTDWMVSADNVRDLIWARLIPMGLVASPDGSLAANNNERARSPLALNVRMKVLEPCAIDPITGILQILYAPPVLIPMLAAVVVAHTWLYLIHGVAGAFRDALYTPGALLVVLIVMLAGGIFHEFGHASALRYGGGKVGGMGAGLYLIYPVLYTDVTDSYRLGRWGRIRTDLGGFYFHLILALGVIGLYLASGQEFLLLIVLVISLDIVYQCLPFVRFDGYWALADLTGVPDFFSQMGAFLRSVLPVPRWKGAKMPSLKPWVRVVFAAYIIVAVPVLSVLLFLFVTRLPFIVTTLWDALLAQAGSFSRAWVGDDLLTMATSASQALLLQLQLLAFAYLVYRLGWDLIKGIWNWSKPTLVRRVTGALIVIGVITLTLFVWAS